MNNKELLYKKLNALRLEVDSSIVDDIISTVDKIFQEQNLRQTDCSALLPISEELWDEHSEYIDDNLFSLERVAGSSVLTEQNYKKLINDLLLGG